ncbi:MAG TPA: glycosyltransferase family 4 protein [Tepidisphaeraceae bacterium]|nr:glycosyltransferase family 4 protein [Tepidisphaeraceae bacterium]
MKILVAHNYYQQAGGEDLVFGDETALLESRGHEVDRLIVRNDAVDELSATLGGKLRLAAGTIWSRRSAAEIADRVRKTGAQVVHFHNTFPLLSPAVYGAARRAGAAVVQTLHNFRMLCPAATFYRQGAVCEDCLGRLPLAGIRHACYRSSRATTAVAVASIAAHRLLGTYRRSVDAYIAVSQFTREKYIEGGFPADRVHLKMNFIRNDPGAGAGDGGFALFVGRLAPEKGITTLLSAWRTLGSKIPLRICGDGPMADEVKKAATENPAVTWLGRQPVAEVMKRMGQASFLVFPSTWYEGQPRTILESLACGTPIIASDLGAMIETVLDGQTGCRFKPGQAAALAEAASRLLADPTRLAEMRQAARADFEARFTADHAYQRLIEIYESALRRRHKPAALEAPSRPPDKMAACP